jgi:two-component system alkaline phosphatase synthesis response regulator PhoP
MQRTKMHKILLVEDSTDAYHLIQRTLGTSIHLEWARSQREAALFLEAKNYDLVILDVMLPDGDGFQLCSVLQTHERWSTIPVVFLTARTSIPDRVLGFSVGADDFISKPFDPLELKARIEAKLRKRDQKMQQADILVQDALEINKRSQSAYLNEEGVSRELGLTPREFKILLMLAAKPNSVLSREEILNTAWGENIHVYNRSVDTHISKLRKKLGSKADYIQSAHGSGYRFVGEGKTKTIPSAALESFPTLRIG